METLKNDPKVKYILDAPKNKEEEEKLEKDPNF